MYNILVKHGQLMAFGLGLLIALIFILSIMGGMGEYESLGEDMEGTTSMFNFGLWSAIILSLLCALGILGFGLYQTATNPQGASKFLIGIVVIVVIYFLFSSMTTSAEGTRLAFILKKFDIDDGVSKFISGSLGTAVSLARIAAAAFLFSEARNLFK